MSSDASPQVSGGETKDVLRFMTCGSVDDGKSTLIGRLLLDCGAIHDDQLQSLTLDSVRYGTLGNAVDPALLLDGLEAEREQGITIDVAHRFFTTTRRAFVVADTPGHEQYTRNMATGASTAELAVILVDASKGLLPQTRRHSFICSLFGVRHIVLAVNKIDLVDYDQAIFDRIAKDYASFASPLNFTSVISIPVSARYGDNVIERSDKTAWYRGPSILRYLEGIDVQPEAASQAFRFPVQWVNRPTPDVRGYAGTIASGHVVPGDEIVAVPSGRRSRVKRIVTYDGDLARAEAGDAVTVMLDDEIDIGRGDILSRPGEPPMAADQFAATLLWMDQDALIPGRTYLLRIGTQSAVSVGVTAIKYKFNVDTGEHLAAATLGQNEIGFCNLATSLPISFDPYRANRRTGAFIVIDRYTNRTAGAGMIAFPLRRAANMSRQPLTIGKQERAGLKGQTPCIVWFTGLSGAGKSTLADLLDQKLFAMSYHTMLLDGDNVRHGLNRDLGFTEADRAENIRRAGEVARLMMESGLIVICSFISPYQAERDMVRGLASGGEFIEVYVDTPIEECIRRDPKGLYAKARAGAIKNFTGIDAPYEAPAAPEIHLKTVGQDPEQLADQIVRLMMERGLVGAGR